MYHSSIREIGRLLAFYAIYIYDLSILSIDELKAFKWYWGMVEFDNEDEMLPDIESQYRNETVNFANELFTGMISNLEFIDRAIKNHLVNWEFNRLHNMDKAVLRLGVYSLIYRYDIPPEVTIFQANDLATVFSDEKSYKYINGILHSVKTDYRRNWILHYMGKGKV